MRKSLTLLILLSSVTTARAAVEIVSQVATIRVEGNGVTLTDSLPDLTPGTLALEVGSAPGPGDYARSTLTTEIGTATVGATAATDLVRWPQYGSAVANATFRFRLDQPHPYTKETATLSVHGNGILFDSAYAQLSDARGWIWRYDVLGLDSGCNTTRDDFMSICFGGMLPAGDYTFTVHAGVFYPPDCGPCFGLSYAAQVGARIVIHTPGDADGDGVVDDVDDCPLAWDPDQTDTDRDGSGDVCDNCPAVRNPGQEDSDGDGIGDACEADIERALQLITEMIATVDSLPVSPGIDQSLVSKLVVARRLISDGNDPNDVAASNVVLAFLHAVQAQRGTQIPDEAADALQAEAAELLAVLGGG